MIGRLLAATDDAQSLAGLVGSSSDGLDEAVFLFCGRVDCRGAGGIHGVAAEQEDIRVIVKTVAEVEAMLDKGQIDSAHTLISLYWLLRHRDRLRKEWR